MTLQDKFKTAEQLGVSWQSVILYKDKKTNPLPSYKSRANKINHKGKNIALPEELKSNNNQRKLIFIKEEVQIWMDKYII